MRVEWPLGLILAGLVLLPARPSLQQARPGTNLVAVPEETALVAQGWAALGSGDAAAAAGKAQQVLAKYPQSVGGLALAVEAAIAGRGALAGLTAYESWLGVRKVEDPYVIRRVAMAVLREISSGSDRARLLGLKALAAEGDPDAMARLADANAKGQQAEMQVMAELGDPKAVAALVKRLETAPTPGSKQNLIAALAGTKSKAAVPVLMKTLDDKDQQVVAAAADALGKLNAREAIPRLRPLVDEGHFAGQRWAAARSLALMGDAGGVPFLREMLAYKNDDAPPGEADMMQISAAEALAPLGPNPDWIETARRIAGSPNPQARIVAAKIIAAYDQALAKETLDGLLQHPNVAIQQEAAEIFASRVAGDFLTLRRLLWSQDLTSRAMAAGRIAELTR
jgi:hypothetical protein